MSSLSTYGQSTGTSQSCPMATKIIMILIVMINDYNRQAEITIISGIIIKTGELYTCLLMIIGSVFNQFDIDR